MAYTSRANALPLQHARHPSLPYQITLAVVALGLLGLALFCTFTYWAMLRVDANAAAREKTLISRAIDERIDTVRREQQKVTVGDDVFYLTMLGDTAWMAENIGAWMHSSYGHEQGYVLDDRNAVIYAMRQGETVSPARFDEVSGRILPLVRRVRQLASEDAAAGNLGLGDVMSIDGRPSIVTVKPIVPGADPETSVPGDAFLHVAVKHVDNAFFVSLGERYLVANVRFRPRETMLDGQNAVPIAGRSAWHLGYVAWDRERPGLQLIQEAAPGLATALLVVAALVAFLLLRIRRAAAQVHASENRAHHLAYHDALTGLPNRSLLRSHLEQSLNTWSDANPVLALHYIDLDRFKNVNDTLGHPAGDELIRAVARRLCAIVGENDMVARLGGDEFAIVQGHVTGRADVERLADAVMRSMTQPFDLLGNQVFVGASAGIAIASETASERADLSRKADIALYEAKGAGKGQYCVFRPELDDVVHEKQAIERDLRIALADDRGLHLVYQPIYALDRQTILGAEALVRWDHPVRGVLSPALFVPVAEERGLIRQLGSWVLREACETVKSLDLPWVAVNVSAIQFRDPAFTGQVLDLLHELDLDPSRLQLEITEGLLLDLTDEVREALAALRRAGIKIALDDFGTGYSSLQYLHRCNVDKIKIDRSFVQRLRHSREGDAIVRAILDLAKGLDLTVTAEGVETVEQHKALLEFGCSELQGFLLSKPLEVRSLQAKTTISQPANGYVPSSEPAQHRAVA